MPGTFLREIAEHPGALRALFSFYRGEGRKLLTQWRSLLLDAKRVIFAGMGTSEIVAESVLPKLSEQGIDASVADAGELLHYPRTISGLLVLISQSGESAETRRLAEKFQGQKNIIALTNNPRSTAARLSRLNLPMHAGQESAIATKTYLNTLALLFLMAQPVELLDAALGQLEDLSRKPAPVPSEKIEQAAALLADAKALHFISRGPALSAAKQAALTFMEGTRLSSTAFTGGAFRHGPYELVDSSHRCVFFIPGGKTFDLLTNMATEVAAKGSHMVIITDQEFSPPTAQVCCLTVPPSREELFSIAAAPTQELLLEALARRRGVVAGAFRNSQKITAVE